MTGGIVAMTTNQSFPWSIPDRHSPALAWMAPWGRFVVDRSPALAWMAPWGQFVVDCSPALAWMAPGGHRYLPVLPVVQPGQVVGRRVADLFVAQAFPLVV